ncbi:serine/arginine repetitive matrix protein 2-like [Eriocheir sinensis]|uniref:serine/arginine repetitive matrix protein 2-like n=1 Tax=Eriocheir sinensis TaxID=95602 RepID=UPI0021C607BD|nr:serine/arginine repetitive matrix protein 2-like [Eriocheir sinensis]
MAQKRLTEKDKSRKLYINGIILTLPLSSLLRPVPPKKIRILNEEGLEVSGVIGPYPMGASLTLVCQVDTGRPRPKLSWFFEEKLLDDVVEVRRGEITSNTLHLPSLTRNYLYRVLTCQASNSNLSVPVAATVTLDMSFPPLDVRIMGTRASLSEGERYAIVCESSGSRPSATITWWKNGMMMTDTKNQIFNEGNVSRSTLYLTPSLADDDAYVSCRAKNPLVPNAVLEDSRKLNVHYTPRLSLAAGLNLDMDDIKEGDDVYFECGIKANPPVFKVQWFHNLNRNLHGVGSSNAVQLSVKFAPTCRPGQKAVYGVGKHEELNITCSVEAHPEPASFRWAFNSSSEVVDIPSTKFWVVGNGKSQASYTPRTHLDYGSLLCWANNEVGRQQQPCIYHIIHAATPEPVNNCTVENVSSTSASVRCQAGWDGGLAQTFTLSVTPAASASKPGTREDDGRKEAAPRVLANTSTAPKPEFFLTGLEPGTKYVLTIMGVNKKGESEPMHLAIFTLKDVAEKRTSQGVGVLAFTPILAVLLGVVASLFLMALVIALVVRSRRPRDNRKQEVKMVYDKGASASTTTPLRGATAADDDDASPTPGATATDDANPDVIPVNDDHQVKELQTHTYTAETMPITDLQKHHQQLQKSPPTSPSTGQHLSSPQQQHQQQQQHGSEYLQGHDGSFYINPGNLLRQKGLPVVMPREGPGADAAGTLIHLGRPLAASSPAARAVPPTLNMVSSSSSGTNTPEGAATPLLDHPRKAARSSLRDEPREGLTKGLPLEGIAQDSPASSRLSTSRSSVSSSFRMPRSRSPSETCKSVSGSLKYDDPRRSPSRTRVSPSGSFKLELPEEAKQALSAHRREGPGSFKGELSVRSKLEVPEPVRRNSVGSIGPGLPLPQELIESLIKVQPTRHRRESLEVPSLSYNRERSDALRRGSIGSFVTSTPENLRKSSLGSCKVHGSQRSPSGSLRSPTRSHRKDSSGSQSGESPRRSPSDNYKTDSGTCKLHTPKRSPSEGFQREASGSLKDPPAKSSSSSFQREMTRSLKSDPCTKVAELITRELSRSLRVDASRKSPSGGSMRESPGAGFKAESSRRSPSGSYKSPSGSFKGLEENLHLRRKSCSGGFVLDPPKRESLGFNLDAPRKGSTGSCKLETPKVSPSGSGTRESPGSRMLDTSRCSRKGSWASPTGGSPNRQRKKSLYAFPTQEQAGALMLASPSNLTVDQPWMPRKGSLGSLTGPRHGSLESLLSAAELGEVVQVSQGSGETDVLGNFKIDSSKDGHLVVTQMAGSPSSQPGSSRPDRLRIVCPLDTKIRIELKMD